MSGKVLSFCDHTGNMALPWAEAGYECFIFDIQHPIGISDSQIHKNIKTVGGSILDYYQTGKRPFELKDIKMCFAFPPCTDLAVSGARYFKSKGLTKLVEALKLVDACRILCEESSAPWFLENPVSTISSYWKKPDYMFDPCDYGGYLPQDYVGNSLMPAMDAYTKKTCLWTGGGFIMPPKKEVKPEKVCEQGSWLQKLGGKSAKTKSLRSATPMGFARAVFEANNLTVI